MGRISAIKKEKTKLREQNMQAITTKIFEGLKKHGGFNLPPWLDISEVLQALAEEAGQIVELGDTTYRNQVYTNMIQTMVKQGLGFKVSRFMICTKMDQLEL